MKTKEDVQRHVAGFLSEKRWSMRRLALAAGLPPSTLARMMEDNPAYRGEVSAWQQLARYRDLGLDEAEVLGAVGLGPRPANDTADPWQLLEAAMRGFRLTDRYRDHLRRQVEFLLAAHQTEAPNGC
jgi:hypothetical protein